MTIDEIAERLAISRTTIYYWVRDIPIDRKPPRSFPAKARYLAAKANKNKFDRLREIAYRTGVHRLSNRKVSYSIQYHVDQDLEMLRGFWSNRLGIEPHEIKRLRKSNSSGLATRVWRCRFGVMSVTTHDTYFRSRMQAWMDRVQQHWLDSAT